MNIDEGLDILIAVIALVCALTIAAWGLDAIKNAQYTPVDEKTSIHNVYGSELEPPTHTIHEAVLGLVIADAYQPAPTQIVYQHGTDNYIVNYNTAYFLDKEASIDKAWTEFFKSRMSAIIESSSLQPNGAQWIVNLVG